MVGTGDTRGGGNIFKFPVSPIAIEYIAAIEPTKIKIDQSIPVHVTGRDAGTAEQVSVRERMVIRQEVFERDSRVGRVQKLEPGSANPGHGQFAPATTGARLPIQFCYNLGEPD